MIRPERSLEICGILPRIRKFPRSPETRAATIADCAKLLSDRCETEAEAIDICERYQQPGQWISADHFRAHIDAVLSDIPSLEDQRRLAAHAYNSLYEPIRLGDIFIGWCGRRFSDALINRAKNFPDSSLLEQARIGRATINENISIEAAVWNDIQKLRALDRTALEKFARREFTGCISADNDPHHAMVLAFDSWSTIP